LARIKYLKDVKSSLPAPTSSIPISLAAENQEEDDQPVQTPLKPKSGWFNYFSVEAMGLADYVDEETTTVTRSAGVSISGLLPTFLKSSPVPSSTDQELFDQEDEQAKNDAERMFLSYSWWLLHEGWQGVADRVDEAVERVFAK
jgi:peroxin-3